MNNNLLDRLLSFLAFLAAGIVLAMVVGILATHASQDFFQSARAINELTAKIAENPGNDFGYRLNLGLDNLLIVVYGTFFVLLAAKFRESIDPIIVNVGLGAMLLTVFLDIIENHNIMMMLHSIERGLPFDSEHSSLQMIVSSVKFHCSYIGLVLFSVGYWKQGSLGKLIGGLLAFGYVPLGILIMALPVEAVKPVALARVCFFVLAFVLSGTLFKRLANNATQKNVGESGNLKVKPQPN
jgi:hypothetical protein